MSVQSYQQILGLLADGVVLNSGQEYTNAASLDVTLGRRILVESGTIRSNPIVSLRRRDPLPAVAIDMDSTNGYLLQPGQFILAQTEQIFNLPDWLSAEYKLKSSMARIGLENLNAGWCDAGWNGSVLTLELKNMTQHHVIHLLPGDRIGQMIFYRHMEVPEEASYRTKGTYNGHKTTTGAQTRKT